jgi:hypothetical protein
MDNETRYTDPLSPEIDLIWSGSTDQSALLHSVNPFEDYFFSGEDVRVYIDGLFSADEELQIASFAYSVRQEKQPLYGFWSYNYDHMMLGTRIISGEFSIFTTDPNTMTSMLEKAAIRRKEQVEDKYTNEPGRTRVSPLRQLATSREDDENIQQYWGYSKFDRIADDPYLNTLSSEPRNIFSSHPPFNFVILYGVEEVALSPLSGAAADDLYYVSNNLDRYLYSDVNQRSLKSPSEQKPLKIILQEVNLINMTTAYVPGGQAIVENYQFLARDYYLSRIEIVDRVQYLYNTAYTEQGQFSVPG